MRIRNIDDIYEELTSVDINKQQDIWDERGKGYYGEYLLFKYLYANVKGICKILMNLQIPAEHGKTTEIDLAMIHETGIYVFEVKHYKGTIYGKTEDAKWTQYFRTSENNSFLNPVRQNQYHISAVKRMFPDVPVYSFVVFTNTECEIKVENSSDYVEICTLDNLGWSLGVKTAKTEIYNIDSIDEMFGVLLHYAPVMQKVMTVDGKEAPLYSYINNIIEEHQSEKKKLENSYYEKQKKLEEEYKDKDYYRELSYSNKVKKNKSDTHKTIVLSVVFAVIVVVISILISNKRIERSEQLRINAEQELAEFAKKFEYVDEFNNGEIQLTDSVVSAYDVVLYDSKTLEEAVDFSCSLKHNGSNYGIAVDEDSKITVILKDGGVKEYDIFNDIYPFYGKHHIGSSQTRSEDKVLLHELHDISMNEISYVKLSNLELWCYINSNNWVCIAENYEIEVYSA